MRVSTFLAFTALAATGYVKAQFGSFPACLSGCVSKEDISCNIGDIKCLCNAAKGSKLVDAVVCAKSSCDSNIDVTAFLNILKVACGVAGETIPNSIISAAESAAATVTASGTATRTHSGGGGGGGSGGSRRGKTTVTELTTTNSAGESYVVVIPIVITSSGTTLSTSTVSGVITVTPGQSITDLSSLISSTSLPESASTSTSTSTSTSVTTATTTTGTATATGAGSGTSTSSGVVQTSTSNIGSASFQFDGLRVVIFSLFVACFTAAIMM